MRGKDFIIVFQMIDPFFYQLLSRFDTIQHCERTCVFVYVTCAHRPDIQMSFQTHFATSSLRTNLYFLIPILLVILGFQ